MNLEKVFYILRKRKSISKDKLYECGVSDKFIDSLIENEILTVADNGEYKIDSIDETIYYGRYLLEEKKYSLANSIFICCYMTDPTNFNANFQLFYYSLTQKKKDNVFKHFDVVYDKLKENDREADANYYLYLLGTLYGLPEKYRMAFNDLEEEDILLPEVDGFSIYENTFRKEVFSNSYFKVNAMFDERFDYDDRRDMAFEDALEKELILKWLVKNRNFNKMIRSYLEDDKMVELKSLLDVEDEKRFLSKTNQYVLRMVNQYLTTKETGNCPTVRYNGEDVFEAIDGNNYLLAISLVEKYMKEHNIDRDNNLLIALNKFISLVDSKEEEVVSEVKEVKETKLSLSDKEKQSIKSKVRQLYNGRSAFLLESMSKEKRDLIREFIKDDKDISAFGIGPEGNRRLVLRYRPYVKEYVSIFDEAVEAKRLYRRGKYEEAASKYELLLKIGKPRDITYGMYGLTLLKLHRKNEALDYLKIATIMSKEADGKLDYSNIIETIEFPQDKENKKPRVVVEENEFEDNNKTSLSDELLNDLIGLYTEGEISLIDACKKLNLSDEDINYVKLLYARDCYYKGNNSEGELYFKQVEKSKAKDKRVKDLYKEVSLNKKYYHNRLDSDKNQLVFVKK